jgi:phenylpropionate dioxygenase-like ring-hydroxylating dioxygenase large terminal subunit
MLAPTANATTNLDALICRDRVHSSVYTDPAIFAREMETLFHGGWVFVGHDSEIPEPDDYLTRMLGMEPVIMVRRRDGGISVLSNRCSHRGNLLCPLEKGRARAFTCDYHAWSFSHEGDLIGVPLKGGEERDRSGLGLRKPARVECFHGFVFATFNPHSPPLAEHLGAASELIERSVSLSPTRRITLSAGWVKQHFACNWKMLPENGTDGYHAPFTHASFVGTFARNSQYEMLSQGEDQRKSEAIDWGRGHVALEHAPAYDAPLRWLGTTEEKMPQYVAAMRAAFGPEEAARRLTEGPAHAAIFPNLFLGEMNIGIFQPLSVDECVLWHTPMLLDGVPDEVNTRIVRQSVAAMGPASFLLADDSIISERQQTAAGGLGGWLDLSRGNSRERRRGTAVVGHISDETTNRGFWAHYLKAMQC